MHGTRAGRRLSGNTPVKAVKSSVKEKLMWILLDGNPHSEADLARGAGFSRVVSIQRWIRAFENAGFIARRPTSVKGECVCQLALSRGRTAKKIYSYPEFRQIRPLIRAAP